VQTFTRRSAMSRAAALAGAGALILPLAGCGSSSTSSKPQSSGPAGSSTSTTSTKPQSPKQRYVTKTGVVCQTLAEEIRTVSNNGKPIKQKAEELVVLRERANARLKAIRVPPGDTLAVEWIRARMHAVTIERKVAALKDLLARANAKLNTEYSQAFIRASALGANDGQVGCKGLDAA
jgi:hypothetical protein